MFFCVYLLVSSTGEALYVVLGPIRCNRHLLLLPCNGAFIVFSTVNTDGVVTAQDIIEGIEWLHCSRQGYGCFLGLSWE